MTRLFSVFFVFVLLLTGCYPQPEITPVEQTPERIERMKKLRNPDGSSAWEDYEARKRARRKKLEELDSR